jgi:hypothetical protein
MGRDECGDEWAAMNAAAGERQCEGDTAEVRQGYGRGTAGVDDMRPRRRRADPSTRQQPADSARLLLHRSLLFFLG